jgi:hypothetical protein
MKHNYKIRIDESPPTEEQISRHKNFDRILADHHRLTQPIYRRPLYKNPKAFIGLVLILVIGFLVFQAVEEEKEELALKELPVEIRDAEERAFFTPPLAGLTVDYDNYAIIGDTLYSEVDGQLAFDLGSQGTLMVPRNAFVTGDGSPVPIREVVLRVRHFNDPLEMVAAGIPMHTTDGEDQYQLEAVNMLDVRAERNGTPLELAKGQRLTLVLPNRAEAPDRDLQLYHLDPVERKWIGTQPAYEILRKPLNGESIKAHRPTDDGFNMVEFDENGEPIRNVEEPDVDDSSPAAMGYQQQISISDLGVLSLDRKLTHQRYQQARVRLVDEAGKPVTTYALYKLIDGVNTVAYFWPQDKELTFELSYLPGLPQTVFGFTSDGHLFQTGVDALGALVDDDAVQDLKVRISDRPVQNIDELKQLLSADSGQ